MAQRLIIKPIDFPIPLSECPPGFFTYDTQLCFKSEYGDKPCNSGGENLCVEDHILVTPCYYEWEEI